MRARVEWMERHQVVLYLAALAVGAVVGLLVPAVAHPAELAINPVLGLLLYATFLGIPFARIGRAMRDWRFLAAVLIVNFVLVPIVVWVLSRIVAHDQVLLVGVLFVLLTPCVDYVIVFTGIAGGAKDRLLAATPLLMIAQMVLLPFYLWLLVGADFVVGIDLAPFAVAFVLLIVLPLIAAGLTQLAARTRPGARVQAAVLGAMVPLMMLTLVAVVASQIAGVGQQVGSLLLTVPVYVLFAVVMILFGTVAGVVARLDVRGGAPSFSAARRATRWLSSLSSSRFRRRSLSPRWWWSPRLSSSCSSWSCSSASSLASSGRMRRDHSRGEPGFQSRGAESGFARRALTAPRKEKAPTVTTRPGRDE